MATPTRLPDVLLCRTFDHLTQTWKAPGMTPITAEVAHAVLGPRPDLVDLLVLLAARDRTAAEFPNAAVDRYSWQ